MPGYQHFAWWNPQHPAMHVASACHAQPGKFRSRKAEFTSMIFQLPFMLKQAETKVGSLSQLRIHLCTSVLLQVMKAFLMALPAWHSLLQCACRSHWTSKKGSNTRNEIQAEYLCIPRLLLSIVLFCLFPLQTCLGISCLCF